MLLSLDLQLFAEKTEKATPRKKQDARKKGQVAKSTDLTNAIVLIASFSILGIYGQQMAIRLFQLVRSGLSDLLLMNLTEESVPTLFVGLLKEGALIAVPVIFIAWLASLASNLSQVGFLVAPESLKWDLNKLNPVTGAKRLFSARTLVEFIKSLLKVIAVATVAGLMLWSEKGEFLKLPQMEPLQIVGFISSLMIRMGLTISAVYLVIAAADLVYQRFDFAKKLRMSKQEIKDEFKKTEGDPLIKHKIKEKQRQMSRARMMQEIPNAQVVVTNPTHYAVAIAYEAGKMQVPIVVAKGADFLALKIKEAAKEHRIVIMENKPLARALYASVEIGGEIPDELFKAVAEILAYVYRIKGTLSSQRR
ncbi:flagellar biosynthesis protein FlhB [Neobacillus sp. NPDC058068]|uniref:flagellar biosynthesis protein FlhB n=1 Tax=Neobacillus sp. NPDC058068 TaxID=3346325 RepID=UPI0036DB7BC5